MNRGRVNDDVQASKPADGLCNDGPHFVEAGHVAAFDLQVQTRFRGIASQFFICRCFNTAGDNLAASRGKAHGNRAANSRGTRNQSYFPGKLFHRSSILGSDS